LPLEERRVSESRDRRTARSTVRPKSRRQFFPNGRPSHKFGLSVPISLPSFLLACMYECVLILIRPSEYQRVSHGQSGDSSGTSSGRDQVLLAGHPIPEMDTRTSLWGLRTITNSRTWEASWSSDPVIRSTVIPRTPGRSDLPRTVGCLVGYCDTLSPYMSWSGNETLCAGRAPRGWPNPRRPARGSSPFGSVAPAAAPSTVVRTTTTAATATP
jgi:hypothetical protein